MGSQDKLVLESGGIRIEVEYRRSGRDEGWTFRVYGKNKKKEIELLRFDCFKYNPHYHYDPSGKNEQHAMDKKEIPDPAIYFEDVLRRTQSKHYN